MQDLEILLSDMFNTSQPAAEQDHGTVNYNFFHKLEAIHCVPMHTTLQPSLLDKPIQDILRSNVRRMVTGAYL